MARQIIDLPRIDLADLADDDLLIIRDSNAKKDKRITVGDLKTKLFTDIPDGVISTNAFADGVVTGSKIAQKTIEPRNLKYQAFAPIWSVFVLEGTDKDLVEVELTTRLGTKLVVEGHNGCTGYVLKSGFKNIDFIKMRGSSKFSQTLTGNFGIHGLNGGATVWTYVTGGASNGTYFNASSRTSTVSADYPGYGDLANATAGNKGNVIWNWVGIRNGNTATWHIVGDVHSGGSAVYVHHLTEANVGNVDRGMPTFYQGGATVSNVSHSKIVIEVLEYA